MDRRENQEEDEQSSNQQELNQTVAVAVDLLLSSFSDRKKQQILSQEKTLKKPMDPDESIESGEYIENYSPYDTDQETLLPSSNPFPKDFSGRINFMGGCDRDWLPQVVMVKKLSSADIDETRNRLSIPIPKMHNSFLEPPELEELRSIKFLTVEIIEPNSSTSFISLSKWRINNVPAYVLFGEWNQVLERNADYLKKGVIVELWSFRMQNKLWLALSVGENELSDEEKDIDDAEEDLVLEDQEINLPTDPWGDSEQDETDKISPLP